MKNMKISSSNKMFVKFGLTVFVLVLSASSIAGDYASYKRYNKMGQVTAEIGPVNEYGTQTNRITTRYTYNYKGELTVVETGRLTSTVPAVTIAPNNWYSNFSSDTKTINSYNVYGERYQKTTQSATGAIIGKTLFEFDQYGRLICKNMVTNLSSSSTICRSPGSNTVDGYNRITLFTYNDFDQIMMEYRAAYTSFSQVYKEYFYNFDNRLQAVQDANGNRTEYKYDGLGRLQYVYFPSEENTGYVNLADYEKYTYDSNGNQLSVRKRSGDVINYQYDKLNRVIYKNLPNTTKDIYYDYDLRGLKLYSKFYSDSPSQQGVARTYDGFGRITTESNKMLWHVPLVNKYQYDEHGNKKKLTYPDGTVVSYTYDKMDRVKTIDLPGVSSHITYSYNAQGLPEKMQRPNNTSTQFTYDAALRVQTVNDNLSGSSFDNTYTYAYNPVNQIKNLTVTNQNYAVDHTAQGTPGKYVVNGLNQYTEANGGVLDYDASGNLILDDASKTIYEYSDENQLTKAIINSSSIELGYDAAGRLLNIGNTYFLYDGESVIAEYTQQDCYPCGRTMTKRYVHNVGVDNPIVEYNGSSSSSSAMTYLHKNYQGSIVAGSNSSGSLLYNNGYDSFGVPEPTNQGRFGYTGQMYLREIDLYYYKARIYHPKLGRFLQTDPVGYEDQMNLYAYTHNDPINYTDPTGEVAFLIPVAIFIGKEIAAEVASRATGGATDFLSARRMGTKGIKLAIKMKKNWSADQVSQAKNKVAALDKAAKNGELQVTKNPQRASTSAKQRYESENGKGSAGQGNDVDHTKELQLGGSDTVDNMAPLDSSVNRSVGAQIQQQIKDVPAGTKVCGVEVCN